ncbi:hypothetical protein ES703_83900 [subsurface metagenome]
MKRTLNKPIRDEQGQALILVLLLMLLAGLIIAPLLGFMSTGIITQRKQEQRTLELYAADAGIEDALWRIKYLDEVPTDPYDLTETVNEMSVSVVIEEDIYFYGEEVGAPSTHDYWLQLESELLGYVGDDDWGVYTFLLSLTNKTGSHIKLYYIKIACPVEFEYLSGLTNEDIDGLALPPAGDFVSGNPPIIAESGSSKIITWTFPTPRPQINAADLSDPENPIYTTVTCSFQVEGPPGSGILSFLSKAARDDVGTVWEFKPFRITATAQAEDGSTTVIKARVFKSSDTVLISSWQIE